MLPGLVGTGFFGGSDGPYGSHRYWRVFITQNAGGSATQIAELEFRGSVGGSDLTGSGTAISGGSGTDGVGASASNAFDNNTSNVWNRSSATNTYIGYDFGAPVAVAEAAITAYSVAGEHVYAPQSFSLDYSDDNVSWTTAASFTAYGWVTSQQRVYPETASASGYHRFWRLFCVDNNGGTSFVGISEMELRATASGADLTAVLPGNNGNSSGRVIGSSVDGAGVQGYLAFNNNAADCWAATGTTNQWVAYVFSSPVTVLEAMLNAGTGLGTTRLVKNGKIEWSDDGDKVSGGTWTTAATFTKTGWASNEQITVTVTP